jgi:CHAT domain-containing protein
LLRSHFNEKFEYLSRPGMKTYLRSLGANETVLTYHISPAMAQVWVAHRGMVQRRILANPAGIHSMLQEARAGLADIGITSFRNNMDSLGDQLLLPVADLLSETIYWIPAGPLLGFPLDALRIKGRYLAERHQVVNLLSFPANPNPVTSLEVKSMQSIFLAGHPQDYSSDYATRLDTSTEIRALADIFVGPGLNIVQGAALLPDEFLDQRFTQAGLVHLEMPGVIDLKNPGQSSLELSGNEDDPQRMSYGPEDIQPQQLKAGLVFLSATRLSGEAPSGFSSQPGLISDFVEAGAQAVIASTWASGGKTDEAFLADIYNRLLSTGNIADSLRDAKRQYLKNNKGTGLYGWAGYQLFIE